MDVVSFVVDTVPHRGGELVRVRSPDVQGLNVLEPTKAATNLTRALRRTRGHLSEFEVTF